MWHSRPGGICTSQVPNHSKKLELLSQASCLGVVTPKIARYVLPSDTCPHGDIKTLSTLLTICIGSSVNGGPPPPPPPPPHTHTHTHTQRVSSASLSASFLLRLPEQSVEQTVELWIVCDIISPTWRHCNKAIISKLQTNSSIPRQLNENGGWSVQMSNNDAKGEKLQLRELCIHKMKNHHFYPILYREYGCWKHTCLSISSERTSYELFIWYWSLYL